MPPPPFSAPPSDNGSLGAQPASLTANRVANTTLWRLRGVRHIYALGSLMASDVGGEKGANYIMTICMWIYAVRFWICELAANMWIRGQAPQPVALVGLKNPNDAYCGMRTEFRKR